jgi:rare lipoprotein A
MKKLLIMSFLLCSLPVKAETATYYHPWFEGRKTFSGDIYRGYRLTAASMVHRMGTRLKVTNLKNGKSVIVRVNDRGNFSHRNIDLSMRAFETIARLSTGRIKVKIEVIK